MAMYRVQPIENKMQLFLSTRFGDHYQEHDLENWLEQNPQILTNGEPLLIISRQPSTPFSGVPDLIGLDEVGNTVVVELKRGHTPRDVLAQALEYTAWLASLTSDEAVTRYLRTLGVDINLIEYRYYRITTGEEMIDFELTVGPEQDTPTARQATAAPHYTEEKVYTQWSPAVQQLYFRFKQQLLDADEKLQVSPQKTAVSFYKQTRDARVYLCSINAYGEQLSVSFRTDSLEPHMDVETAVANITQQAPDWMLTNRGIVWYTMRFMGSETAVDQAAHLIINNLLYALNRE